MTEEPWRDDDLDPRRVAPEGPEDHPRAYLVGEAPGVEECAEGRPFVGPAGKALRAMLEEAGIDAARVRLSNAVPYRPIVRSPAGNLSNRAPKANEIRELGEDVLGDIRGCKPRVIVALGTAAASLLGVSGPISRAREGPHRFDHTPLYVTYHPGYVRRFGGVDSALWRRAVADLRRAWCAASRDRPS